MPSSTRTCSFPDSEDMTQAILAAQVAHKVHPANRQPEAIVGIFPSCITEALRAGDEAGLRGFESFWTRSRNSGQGRNPGTGGGCPVPARKAPFFGAGKERRESVTSVHNG